MISSVVLALLFVAVISTIVIVFTSKTNETMRNSTVFVQYESTENKTVDTFEKIIHKDSTTAYTILSKESLTLRSPSVPRAVQKKIACKSAQYSVALLANDTIATGSFEEINLFSSFEYSFIKKIKTTGYIISLVAIKEEDILISGSSDNTITMWNVTSGQAIQTLLEHTNSVNCLTLLKQNKLLASGSDDHSIILWNVTTGQVITKLNGHNHSVMSLTALDDDHLLASGSRDSSVKIW